MNSILVFVFIGLLAKEAVGHGMMLDPPNRSSVWRFVPKAVVNYDDNANYCGGAQVQHGLNGGRCGVCGDSYTDPHPQDNENTGKYGSGLVVARYKSGIVMEVSINLTTNHIGTFHYSVCVLTDPSKPEPGEDCFIPILLEDGSISYNVSPSEFEITNRIRIPQIHCDRCVLRWHYTAGNNWGLCEDGTTKLGCGPQETFRSCADIAII